MKKYLLSKLIQFIKLYHHRTINNEPPTHLEGKNLNFKNNFLNSIIGFHISQKFMCTWSIHKAKTFENSETHEIQRGVRNYIDSCEARSLDTNDHTAYGYHNSKRSVKVFASDVHLEGVIFYLQLSNKEPSKLDFCLRLLRIFCIISEKVSIFDR